MTSIQSFKVQVQMLFKKCITVCPGRFVSAHDVLFSLFSAEHIGH